jgi:hypothetical protein
VSCCQPSCSPLQADANLPLYANAQLTPQSWAYNSCLLWFGARHKFVALLDADEFLIIKPPAAPDASDAAAAAAPNASAFSLREDTPASLPSRKLGSSAGDQARPNITAFLQPFEGARTTAALPLVHMPPAYLHTTAPAVNATAHLWL